MEPTIVVLSNVMLPKTLFIRILGSPFFVAMKTGLILVLVIFKVYVVSSFYVKTVILHSCPSVLIYNSPVIVQPCILKSLGVD